MRARPIPPWLAAEYPFTPRCFRTPDGCAMSYLDEGPRAAEAVLMLHGNPTWSFHYRHLVRTLAPRMRCIVPDHVGMGASEKPARGAYTLAARIRDVTALVGQLGLARLHLVVHDWGGAIGFGLATQRPALVGRIVLMNTAAFVDARIPARIALCRLPWLGALVVRGANGFAWPATWMAMHRRKLTARERRGYLWPYASWADRVGVHAFVRDIPRSPAHPTWATLQAIEAGLTRFNDRAVLIVWGARDFCFNDHFLDRWRRLLPAAEVARHVDAGHYVLEDAREEAVGRISSFLATA